MQGDSSKCLEALNNGVRGHRKCAEEQTVYENVINSVYCTINAHALRWSFGNYPFDNPCECSTWVGRELTQTFHCRSVHFFPSHGNHQSCRAIVWAVASCGNSIKGQIGREGFRVDRTSDNTTPCALVSVVIPCGPVQVDISLRCARLNHRRACAHRHRQ